MPPVGFYVLGVISILIVISAMCLRNKEGLTNAVNFQLLGKLKLVAPDLKGSATSHPIALSRPALANELADFRPVDLFGNPTSPRVTDSVGLANCGTTTNSSSDSCPSGCTKPTTAAANCACITAGEEKKDVCPYVCTGDHNSGCQGLDEVCRDCGNVILSKTTLIPTPAPCTPKNKFYNMVVQFSNTSSKPSPRKPESPYIDTLQYCDGGKVYIHADSYNASSQEVSNEAECIAQCDKDSSCQMMLMSSPTTCHLYRDVDDVSMHCDSIPGYAAYWGKVRSDRYKGQVKFPVASTTPVTSKKQSCVANIDKYYVTNKGVLRKTGAGCTQRPVVLDMSLTDFLIANKFTVGSPMSSSDTCAISSSS